MIPWKNNNLVRRHDFYEMEIKVWNNMRKKCKATIAVTLDKDLQKCGVSFII